MSMMREVYEVLSLYRSILRQGRLQLKLTDQNYFRRLVREEFERNRHEQNTAEIQFQIQVSQQALTIIFCCLVLWFIVFASRFRRQNIS